MKDSTGGSKPTGTLSPAGSPVLTKPLTPRERDKQEASLLTTKTWSTS